MSEHTSESGARKPCSACGKEFEAAAGEEFCPEHASGKLSSGTKVPSGETKIVIGSLTLAAFLLIVSALVFNGEQFLNVMITSTVFFLILMALQYFGVISIDLSRFKDSSTKK